MTDCNIDANRAREIGTKNLTLREVIDRAGGILVVAQKLRYGHGGVSRWYYGSRCPMKAGRIRADLCRLAGVSMDDVAWQRKG